MATCTKSGRARDNQRLKFWRAFRSTRSGPRLTMNEILKLLERIAKSKRLSAKYGPMPEIKKVKDGRGRSYAGIHNSEMTFPIDDRSEWDVCRLMAHEIHDNWKNADYPRERHGWQFCAIYLDLVKWVLGKEAYTSLKDNFKKHRVRSSRPKVMTVKREVTPEMLERLASARQKRMQNRTVS